MLRFKRLTQQLFTANARQAASSFQKVLRNEDHLSFSPFPHPSRATSVRFLDIYQGSKDEMSRGYFADMSDLKKHGGKIATANKVLVPAATAVKFPTLEVSYSDGKIIKLPVGLDGNAGDASKLDLPKATLLCLSFRASSQAMVDSWSKPFIDTFSNSENIQLYEERGELAAVVKMLANGNDRYMFLVDKFGRIRWQGFGTAAQDELSSLLSCTSALLEEN
ncbi:hypothetical protein Cgig2_023084 [Carnegiea gigantea]|uniref:Mitochondrial ATPase complex subunit ATP10 n=1 Tax=Carnegiea gigantea TaxID=171969 RepID=A0A9Q1JLY8_9CARY|nr:hypothetical protein Cgig2_023084 [Carnegiea gigantea]